MSDLPARTGRGGAAARRPSPGNPVSDLTALTRLCPPPGPSMSIKWDTVEAELRMPLPRDYKELAERYGPGRFCDYLGVFHPYAVTGFADLTGPVPGRVRAHLREDHDRGSFPVPCHPDLLFAVGATDNGEYLFWITEPETDPDAWRVAVNEARGPRWYTHDGTLTDFLVAVLSGRTRVPQFPADLLDAPPAFSPSPSPGKRQSVVPRGAVVPHGPVDAAVVRAWARSNGYDVPVRGRIPHEVLDAWRRATTG
ncbi:histone-like nucleoid-structuring protein Lsr2 [Streptomyces sp. NPDC052644]